MKQLALATLIASAALVGCTTYDTPNHGRNVSLEPSHNFLGIVKVESGIYAPQGNAANSSEMTHATVGASMSEFYGNRTPSGDRITLLWGAVTLFDY